jgi:hypothetical protein
MLQSEAAIEDAPHQAGVAATAEVLRRFDTDGQRIASRSNLWHAMEGDGPGGSSNAGSADPMVSDSTAQFRRRLRASAWTITPKVVAEGHACSGPAGPSAGGYESAAKPVLSHTG